MSADKLNETDTWMQPWGDNYVAIGKTSKK